MDSEQRTFRGGIGEFLPPSNNWGFGLKIVRLMSDSGERNDSFWKEALSIHFYCSSVRFLAGCMKIPLAAHYYINREDPLFRQNPCRKENVLSIDALFHSAFIKSEPRLRYRDYKPVSEELLKEIYENELTADLLMIYPIAYGGEKNLTSYYGSKQFSPKDARSLICQISATILDLYRCGTAHGDIKPENIMVSELDGNKIFRFTDFGSAHFENAKSNTGTKAFFDSNLYKNILLGTNSALTARVYTDFYALNRTLVSLVLGHHPNSCCVNEDIVTDRWQEIADLWEKLQNLESRTLDDFRELAAEAKASLDPNWEPYYSYCNEFEPMLPINDSLEYGRLHEQITFSDQFDPLMRIRGIRTNMELCRLFPEFYHIPLIVSHYGVIFHAPDDAQTEKPPQDFYDYMPCDLNHIHLTAEEAKRLIGYGKKLNAYFQANSNATPYLPRKEDIFRCSGTMKMMWGIRKNKLKRPIDYGAYFRFLATNRAVFKPEDWLILLPLIPELQKKLSRTTCLKLLDRFSRDSSFAWLFGIETFLKHISGENFKFESEHWLKICRYTCRFDDRIDSDTAWKMFKAVGGTNAKILLENHPVIAGLLRSSPSPETDAELYFHDFHNLRKWDKEAFLMYFPEKRRARFSGREWEKCLHLNPFLIEFMPKELIGKLSRKTWVRLLGAQPDRIKECPCIERFSSREWGSILLQQPHLKKFCPPGVVIPDNMRRRQNKKD